MNPLLTELRAAQTQLVRFLDWPDADWRRQFHPDLSPAAWHVGHTAVVEAFWIREQVLAQPIPDAWKALYFPELIAKSARAQKLPAHAALRAFVERLFEENGALLQTAPPAHALMQHDYLWLFLLQHHHQHLEILAQIAQERALADAIPHRVQRPLAPQLSATALCQCEAGEATIGNAGIDAYDNERPVHRVALAAYSLGAHPVSNGQYLGFMLAGGYDNRAYWSDAGWAWLARAHQHAPHPWRQDETGQWYTLATGAPCDLVAADAVVGLSYFEAEAYAQYAQARLPHEYEWEQAARAGAIAADTVGAWEWCANAFFPYPGFKPFPYAGYSTPWFDGNHLSLRGGSRFTAARIRRPSFRNFYTADKRHIFAGLRLAYS